MLTKSLLETILSHFLIKGEPKVGEPGELIEINEDGSTIEVTFITTPGDDVEIGTLRTTACSHPSKCANSWCPRIVNYLSIMSLQYRSHLQNQYY